MTSQERLTTLHRRMAELREEIRQVRREQPPQPVDDHLFRTSSGEVRLSDLFGNKKDLFLIHNMGVTCPMCTLWADGYNGIYPHIVERAAFAIVSPDEPAKQRKIASARGWRFPMVSDSGSAFAAKMGYVGEDGGCLPGVSVLQRRETGIVRVSNAGFRAFDDFCTLWHLFDLLPEGPDGWRPRNVA